MILRTDSERPDPRRLGPAIEAMRRDGVILYPTDTGYAFGCALSSPKAIAKLRRLKGIHEKHRKPLTMLVADFVDFGRYGHMSNQVFRVVRRIMPGPYTIVLPATHEVPRLMRNRDREVGLRWPDHKICSMLVELSGEPLLTGSVTPAEGEIELEDPEELERVHARDVAMVIDGGFIWPQPSTVLRVVGEGFEVLREGQGSLEGIL
jgi:tRNA threonylcarbamoyl adenosine modification protein (Sua5/YciO/YrdC/YwlC family)